MVTTAAVEFLKASDANLEQLIEQVGECRLNESCETASLFEEMVKAILSQQISPKAARTIYQRLLNLYAPDSLTTTAVLATPEDTLRSVGISRPKVGYLKDLAHKIQWELPTLTELKKMEDETVIHELSRVKGVGRWTVQMLLIFRLQREDIWPTEDLGIAKGIQKLYNLEQRPNRKQIESFGQKWKPYRSIAAWYLWRSLELSTSNH